MSSKTFASPDQVAIGLSGLCTIHCIITPVAVILFPTVSACVGSDATFHALLLALVVPSSILALVLGCRRHRDRRVLGLGMGGLGLLVVAVSLGHIEYWERPMTLGASALMVWAHARNYRLCASDSCEY